ncbi:beta-lactamase [Penicillium riverlandense]|uniref:beta-lactamase n=1 Tax=Penicillium riverlandense TaxID=1903569 RepID=UPI0025482B65|nr:beta-lactamase [Penicillium riverlandense]KAJ5808485.1 beta-lactamase [Penicillium riverlandense]
MAEVHGSCDPAFDSVRGLLQQKLADGHEVGASLCVNIDGRNVLDLWGGYEDASKTKPWGRDTITGVWSCTKIITSLAAHILVNRGLLDVNEKVATYWPEFAANGKEDMKVLHILSHSSGLPAFDGPITAEEMQDVEKSAQRLAGQASWFVPGSQTAYQYTNFGLMIGELVRRITGKSLTQFVSEEISKPLGADFQLGVPEEDWPRTAEMIPFSPEVMATAFNAVEPTSLVARAFAGSLMDPTIPNKPVFRKSENGAMGGFSNARALARIGSIVSLDGSVDGKQYLTPQILDEMMKEQIRWDDPCLLGNMRFALGLGLPSSNGIRPTIPEEDSDSDTICFWGGLGRIYGNHVSRPTDDHRVCHEQNPRHPTLRKCERRRVRSRDLQGFREVY